MTCDRYGRPICRLCARLITHVCRSEYGQAWTLTCEHCGAEEVVPMTAPPSERRERRPQRAA